MKLIKDFITRLTSRKFLIALGTMATLAANKQWTEFTAAGITYVVAEGGTDAARAYKEAKQLATQLPDISNLNDLMGMDDEPVDKSVVTPGVIPPTP
jgi:hypothetical protein